MKRFGIYLICTLGGITLLAIAAIVLGYNTSYITTSVFVIILLFVIRYTSVVQSYFMPMSEVQHEFPTTNQGKPQRVCIELVTLHSSRGASTGVTKVLRLSVYEKDSQKYRKRFLLGDDVKFVGERDNKLHFVNKSSFYGRSKGDVLFDLDTLQIV